MKKVFVTGATGLLGAHLCCQLLDKGYSVKALRRNKKLSSQFLSISSYYPSINIEDIEWVEGNILDLSIYEYCKNIDNVFHIAAMVSFEKKHRLQLMETNVKGTENMVNASLKNKVEKFIYVSSVAAIGRVKKEDRIDEKNDWKDSKNNSNYAVSKHLAELEVWRSHAEGLKVAIVNPTVILGPSDGSTSSSAIIKQASKGIPFYTKGINGFVDARDVCEIMIKLCESKINGERFIVNGANISYRELFNLMANNFGTKKPYIEIKPWMGKLLWPLSGLWSFISGSQAMLSKETARTIGLKCYYNTLKIEKALKYTFTPIEKTIKESCEFFNKIQKS